MNSFIASHISDLLLDNIELSQTEFCLSCDKQTIRDQNEGHTIHLNLQPGLSGISVQTLLDNYFCSKEVSKDCNSCQKGSNHEISRTVKKGPKTLVIVLARYHRKNSETKK